MSDKKRNSMFVENSNDLLQEVDQTINRDENANDTVERSDHENNNE